jgi:hypothetical protein
VLTAAAVISPLALTRTEAATFLRKHLPPRPSPPGLGRRSRRPHRGQRTEPGRGHRHPARAVADPHRLPRHQPPTRTPHRPRALPHRCRA